MSTLLTAQTLIFDADDTLWECNKYFELVIDEFLRRVRTDQRSDEEVRLILDDFERKNGYGAKAFATSMVETYHSVSDLPTSDEAEAIERLGHSILETSMETIEGVEETLASLRPHHDLLLFTKGEEIEQRAKIDRSPLASMFDMHIITHDKTTDTYREIIESLNLRAESSWMIGNSLKSDIYPALQTGLGTVYVPNPHTWHMEHLDFEHHPDWEGLAFEIERFLDLTSIFATGNTER